MFRTLTEAERWEWYAAGDPNVAPRTHSRAASNNAPARLLWEIGLILAVPLSLAAATGALLAGGF